MILLTFSILSANVFADSLTAPEFQILGTVPDILRPLDTPSPDREIGDISTRGPTDPVTEDIPQSTITTSQGDASATIETCPPPPSPDGSEDSETILPERATPSSSNDAGVATDLTAASHGTSSDTGAGAPMSGSLVGKAKDKRYLRPGKMVPGSALTARYEVCPSDQTTLLTVLAEIFAQWNGASHTLKGPLETSIGTSITYLLRNQRSVDDRALFCTPTARLLTII